MTRKQPTAPVMKSKLLDLPWTKEANFYKANKKEI